MEELEPSQVISQPPSLEATVNLKSNKKGKQGKTFWEKVWKKKRLEKADTVAVLYLRESGTAERMEIKTEKGFFNINGKAYHVRRDCIYILDDKEKTPLALIPEWCVTPIGTRGWYNQDEQEKVAKLQDHAIQGIRHAERVRSGEEGNNIKMNTKAIVLLVIGLIIGGALLFGYA